MIQGNLFKMHTRLENPIQYELPLGGELIRMNELLGKNIKIIFQDEINCVACGRKTNKSFFQGYCYPCFATRPETDECVLNPEKCRAHEGISRDMAWSEKNCLTDHVVYLAVSSGLKVGVTRSSQVPTRWIDQGAHQAIKLAITPNRHLAGLIEVALKEYFADKTNWQRMLKNQIETGVNLIEQKQQAFEFLPDELQELVIEDDAITTLEYPNLDVPRKVKSLSLDKTAEVAGKLTGIKGQYLILDNQFVLNIRKHNGYKVVFEILD